MSSQLTRLLRVLLSLSLVLWVSGIGCGFVCGNASMAAPHDHTGQFYQHDSSVVAAAMPAMTTQHGSCSRHHGAATAVSHAKAGAASSNSLLNHHQNLSEPVTLGTPEGTMNICPLAANATALATGVRTSESAHAEAVTPTALPATSLNLNPIPLFAPTFFNNRGHTYLRCCVFLI